MLKMQPEKTEALRNGDFQAHLQKEPLQTLKNTIGPNRKTLDDVVIVIRQELVKTEPQATAKYRWHKFTFDSNTKSLSDFLEELNKYAEIAFGDNAQLMIDILVYAKLPLYRERSFNLAYLENGTNDQILVNVKGELQLSGLESDGELLIPTMSVTPPDDYPQKIKQSENVCH